MYEYVFVRLPLTYVRGQLASTDYQREVHSRSDQGWRLVQVLIEQPAAVVREYVLIFERPRAVPGA